VGLSALLCEVLQGVTVIQTVEVGRRLSELCVCEVLQGVTVIQTVEVGRRLSELCERTGMGPFYAQFLTT
jgi:hypothetical protein